MTVTDARVAGGRMLRDGRMYRIVQAALRAGLTVDDVDARCRHVYGVSLSQASADMMLRLAGDLDAYAASTWEVERVTASHTVPGIRRREYPDDDEVELW